MFRAEDWEHYVRGQPASSPTRCARRSTRDDPIVLVQDYHFALAPRMIRERLPRATIITFWHIPWPNAERFGICPWREELLDGHARREHPRLPHPARTATTSSTRSTRFLEARIDREQNAVVQQRPQHAGAPVSDLDRVAGALARATLPPVAECRARASFASSACAPDALLGVGVDRLDYTKGIEERLLAVERCSSAIRSSAAASPSCSSPRRAAPRSSATASSNERVERARRAHQRSASATASYRPIVLLRAHHEPPTVFRYYRAADLCYVSSLHDGMNLVAKEFVAARDDERGVLVLSQFTGAARELTEALIVNPYDLDQASDALALALRMPPDEQRERMRSMRRLVVEFNVYRWAGRMLVDAAELRRKERLTGRLSSLLTLRGARDAS